jgi:hypothetical protein
MVPAAYVGHGMPCGDSVAPVEGCSPDRARPTPSYEAGSND